jgi:transposase
MLKYSGQLTDEQWQKLHSALLETMKKNYHQGSARLLIDAVLWVVLNHAAWRDLPKQYGPWRSTYMRFYRWNSQKIWHLLAQRFVDDQELSRLLDRIVERCDIFAIRKECRTSNETGNHLRSKISTQISPR